MRRIHLFEWEDQPWLPTVFRDFITDHLRHTSKEPMRRPVNAAVALQLKSLLEETGTQTLVDLCAGAGGPLPDIIRILRDELGVPVEALLTDQYPNVSAFRRIERESSGAIKGIDTPVSAFDVPPELAGARTMFTAFHHFRPDEARRVLTDAVQKQVPIAVFEPLERTLRMLALIGVMSFVRGFTHTPSVGRLTAGRFVLTYLCPLAPLVFAWDGAVSVMRSYTPAELLEIARSVPGADYNWKTGRFEVSGPYGPMPTTYILGFPQKTKRLAS
jgi:hypothetical protein